MAGTAAAHVTEARVLPSPEVGTAASASKRKPLGIQQHQAGFGDPRMLQRPDPQSFSRFFASIGFFLCIAAFIAPGLVLRETDVLQLRASDLKKYTAVGRSELERRQRVARDVAKAAPIAGGIAFAVGLALLLYASRQLRRQERSEDERIQAELRKLKRDLESQTEDDRTERLREEAAEEEPAPDIGVEATPADSDRAPREASYAHVERRVIERLERIAPPLFKLHPRVKLRKSSVLLDALLVSTVDQLPDVVVEIKFRRVRGGLDVAEPVRQTVQASQAYHGASGIPTRSWLILVTDKSVSLGGAEHVARQSQDIDPDVIVSLINEDAIDDLSLPRDRLM